MNETASALFSHAMDNDIYLEYMDDPDKYWADRKANGAVYDRLCALLDVPSKKMLDELLEGQTYLDSMETEAAFTTGLAFGLQLLRLL